VCREVCIPGKAELESVLQMLPVPPPSEAGSALDSDLMKRFASSLPKPLPASFKTASSPRKKVSALPSKPAAESTATFFPSDQDILDNPAPQKLTSTAKGLILELKKDANLAANPAQLKGVLELRRPAFELAALPGIVAPPAPSLSWSLFLRTFSLAFLAVCSSISWPCVFPVLFLKGLALVHTGHHELHKLRAHGLVYTVGILVSFWALVAVLLGLRAAGATLGWDSSSSRRSFWRSWPRCSFPRSFACRAV